MIQWLSLILCLFLSLNFASAFAQEAYQYQVQYTGWTDFSVALKTCTPGQFKLPDPNKLSVIQEGASATQTEVQANTWYHKPIETRVAPAISHDAIKAAIDSATVTYTIVGWVQGHCKVNITTNQNAPGYLGSVDCSFQADELTQAASKAKDIADENRPVSERDPSSLMSDTTCHATKQPPLPPTFKDQPIIESPLFDHPVTPTAPINLPPGPAIPPGNVPYPNNP